MNTSNSLTERDDSAPASAMAPPLPQRVAKLRIKTRELAHLAGVSENTLLDLLRGDRQPLRATAQVVEQAITREELTLRDYLVAMHGVPQGEGR